MSPARPPEGARTAAPSAKAPPDRYFGAPPVRVWGRAVRLLHWVLVVAVALAALSLVALFGLHQPAGYVAVAAVLLRAAWGWCDSGHARFTRFVRGPRATLRYAGAVLAGRAPRYLGHNPLGGWMALMLMLCVSGLAVTGWLYTTDALWGDERVERAHRVLAWALLGLVALHLLGVIFTGRRHRENLVASMLDGDKRAAIGDDIG
jgi:cytochrome b